MSAKPPFLRLHYVTLLSAVVLVTIAVVAQFSPEITDDRYLSLNSERTEFGSSRKVEISFGTPFISETQSSFASYFRVNASSANLRDFDRLRAHPRVGILHDNTLIVPSELLEQIAPTLHKDLRRPSMDYDFGTDLVYWVRGRREQALIFNTLIFAGALSGFSLVLEGLLRYYERIAKNPARIISASLHIANLRFSLLTIIVVSLTFAGLLTFSLRLTLIERFGLVAVDQMNPAVHLNLVSELQRGWPFQILDRNSSYDITILSTPPQSRQLEEARTLQIGGVSLQHMQRHAPTLLQQLRSISNGPNNHADSHWNTVPLLQNILTCAAIAFTVGLLAEFLQRRRTKPTSEPATPPPLTSY